ncbi:acyl carrier protein [Streptosporangium sp. NPDC048047]|uniref:acyl carrier protein n=1 Tax=Streptosporangium sp. NPDC048047 TaxID=3155748 RepID=UPI00343D852D
MTARDTVAGDSAGYAGSPADAGPVDAGLAARLAQMISDACDGRVTPEEILATGTSSPGVPLSALGVTSLALLRLIDAVEEEFDVVLDLDGGAAYLDSFPLLAGHVAEGTR